MKSSIANREGSVGRWRCSFSKQSTKCSQSAVPGPAAANKTNKYKCVRELPGNTPSPPTTNTIIITINTNETIGINTLNENKTVNFPKIERSCEKSDYMFRSRKYQNIYFTQIYKVPANILLPRSSKPLSDSDS